MIIIDIQKTVFIPQKHLAQTYNTDQGDVSVIVVTLKDEPFPELYFDTKFIKSSGSKSVRDIWLKGKIDEKVISIVIHHQNRTFQ